MTTPTRCLRAPALVLLSLLLLAACQPNDEIPAMTPEESQTIETLTARMTPRCVGHYLIDLPDGFVINPITTTKLEGVAITIEPMERHRFNSALKARREAIEKEPPVAGGKLPFLRIEHRLQDAAGIVFDRADSPGRAGIGRTLELHAWRNGFGLHLEIEATDYKGAGFDRPDDPPNDVPEKLAHLLNVYERVRGRDDLDVPTEQGVCFANGFLRGEPNDEEEVNLYYHLSAANDVYFSFHHLSGIASDTETLLDRGPAIEKHLKERNGMTLRKGKRESHSLKFEEWLSSVGSETSPGMMFHDMTLEMNSKTVSAVTPLFIVDLDSGVEYPGPALSLEEAAVHKPLTQATFNAAQTVALWDKVTATLRPRPAHAQSATPVSSASPISASEAPALRSEAPRLPLGTALASGTRCPQTGLWQCATDAVGGNRRFVNAGETLSSVLVPVERGFLQKLKGRPQSQLTETVWTLVGYEGSSS